MSTRRAVAYVRVSDESQIEGHSLAGQRREIQRYCERNGYTLTQVYADEGVSAHTDQIAKRPSLAQLLDDARHARFDVVIVHTIDRWARNIGVQRQALQSLGQAGVGFVSVTENFDFSTPAGRLMLTMIGGVSEFFSDQLGVHVVKGLRERAESGLPAGPVPFGYQRQGADKPALVVPPEAEAVETVYMRRVRGDSNGEIAAWLNNEGFRPSGRSRLFTPWAVRDMLRTRFYVGVVTFQGHEFPGQHQAIISEDLFAAAQAMRGTVHPRRTPEGESGLLQGRIFCAHCGSRLHSERNRLERPRYRERHGAVCRSNGHSLPADVIDRQLGDIWASLVLPPEWREGIAQLATEDTSAAARAALEAKKKRVTTAFVDGGMEEADYRRLVAEIDLDLAGTAPALAPVYEEAAALVADLPKVWEKATPDERRRLLAPLLAAVYVDVDDRRVRGLTPTPGFDALLRGAVMANEGAAVSLIDQRTGAPRGAPGIGMVETGEN